MEHLTQNRLFHKTTYSFYDHGLSIKSKGLFNSIEYNVPYEDLSDRVIYESKISDGYKVGMAAIIIFLIVSIINKSNDMIVLGILALLGSLVILYYTREKTASIILIDKRILTINQKIPNQITVREFISSIETNRKEYLKAKYGKIDRDLPYEPQLQSFNWLKNTNVIDEEEFENLKTTLLRNSTEKKIGFSN